MKNWSTKKIISLGFGAAAGRMIYDYFSHEGIDWLRVVFTGVLAILIALAVRKFSK